MIIKQISVFLENRSGQISALAKIFRDNDIDIKALNIAEASEYGIIRLAVTQTQRAYDLLKAEGYIAMISEVAAVAVPDRPGGMYEVMSILEKENINIEYMYSVLGIIEGMAYMIMKVDDCEKLDNILKEHGFIDAV